LRASSRHNDDTLFAALRGALTGAAGSARQQQRGIWAADRSQTGLRVSDQAGLTQDGVVFPKLFRRLTEYFKQPNGGPAGFLAWLADKREQVLDLTTSNFTHFDNVLDIQANKLRLIRRPEELVFVSAKTASPAVAPWLNV